MVCKKLALRNTLIRIKFITSLFIYLYSSLFEEASNELKIQFCLVEDGGSWCVCRQDASDSALQKTIDYACGAGADCSPIIQNGACFNPNTVKSHCSYAVNSYFQRKGQTPQACDFAGAAALTQQDPSPSIFPL